MNGEHTSKYAGQTFFDPVEKDALEKRIETQEEAIQQCTGTIDLIHTNLASLETLKSANDVVALKALAADAIALLSNPTQTAKAREANYKMTNATIGAASFVAAVQVPSVADSKPISSGRDPAVENMKAIASMQEREQRKAALRQGIQ